jgi:hypothetical protein
VSLDRARLSIKFFLDRLRAQTAQLDAQDYPSDHPGPRKWLALVKGLLDTADAYLQTSAARARSLQAREIRNAAELASWAYRCLALLRGAGLDELPYPIVNPLQTWFTELGVRPDTIFRAELLANYELRPIDALPFKGVRNPSRTLSKAILEIEWPIWRVTVPAKALGISTHFAIVAHELGHVLFTEVSWDLGPISRDLDQLKQDVAARLGKAAIEPELFAFLSNVFQDWFQELASDAFALLLTGPAFFFSLGDFFQLGPGGSGVSKTHPAHDLRRRVLHDRLLRGDGNSFAAVFRQHTGSELTVDFNSPLISKVNSGNEIFAYVSSLSGPTGKRLYNDDAAHVLAVLHDFMPQVVPLIFSHVHAYLQDHAPHMVYTVDGYDTDLATHIKPMLLAIPPIESGAKLAERHPVEFASILNVGWAVLLTKLDELQVGVGEDPFRAKRLETLHGLLLQAVELSEARRAWGSV